MYTRFCALTLTLTCLFTLQPHAAQADAVVNIYSAQKEHLIRPILDRFTEETGITVNMTSGEKDVVVHRLIREGELTPADLLLTADIGNIYKAKEAGALKAIDSDILNTRIPAHLRAEDGTWYGLTVRARALFFAKERVTAEELSTYEALTDEQWKNRIAVRSSTNIYNQSLLATMIAHEGKEKALSWAQGITANMVRDPQGGDRDQLKAIAAGEGDVAIANTYYYGLLLNSDDQNDRILAKKLAVFFPNQEGRGTHVNIRGGGVTKHAKNPEHAQKLLEFLTGDEAQHFFASHNYEYPVVEDVEIPEPLRSWGAFKQDTLNLEKAGKYNADAVRLFDEAGWK